MKLKSLFGAAALVGAMAFMAVSAQASTFTAEGTAADGTAQVDVKITPEASETNAQISGYIMEMTYDPTKVTPVRPTVTNASGVEEEATDLAGGARYAVAGTEFAADNTVLVSDIKTTSPTSETLVVAWASATPVALNADATAEVLASVDFTVADGVTADVPIEVKLAAVTDDGTNDGLADGADTSVPGKVEVGGTVYLKGDVTGDGTVNGVDNTYLFQYVSGTITDVKLEELYPGALTRGDVTEDGTTNGVDNTYLFQFVSGVIDSLDNLQ